MSGTPKFWNRAYELGFLARHVGRGRFGFVLGRRRIGKSALLRHLCAQHDGRYHQAVEGTTAQQIEHLAAEFRPTMPLLASTTPSTWAEFFALLSREALPPLLVFDEFPYWIAADPTLPSVLQKWIDHELPRHKTSLIVSGSSQSMFHSQLLQASAPLYGRAQARLHLPPMTYAWFCRALCYPLEAPESFTRYAMVGGVPYYWQLLPRRPVLEQVSRLFFDASAPLADEPRYLLTDEGITGGIPKAILDLVGRGVAKPSELAARIGVPHGQLSRPLQVLLDVHLLERQLPFGESTRSTKRVLYTIADPPVAFYYGTALPHRSTWPTLSAAQRLELLQLHASIQWERFCRACFPGAARYWLGDIELDVVAPRPRQRLLVAECKWRRVSAAEERRLLANLRERFMATPLRARYPAVDFRIFSQRFIATLARQQTAAEARL